MSEIVKAAIISGNRTITIEGPQSFVEQELAKFRVMRETSIDSSKGLPTGLESTGLAVKQTEREFVALKRPRNHPETVAVLAFLLSEEGTKEFTEDDIRRAYIRAAVRPPKIIAQAIRDARNNFDFISAGSNRGTYKLTNHGERTVRFDLPPGEDR